MFTYAENNCVYRYQECGRFPEGNYMTKRQEWLRAESWYYTQFPDIYIIQLSHHDLKLNT